MIMWAGRRSNIAKLCFKRFCNGQSVKPKLMDYSFCLLGGLAMTSGVIEGERRFPKYFGGGGNAVPPNDIGTEGNGDTVAFPLVGLQRNAKSMVS